MHSHTHIQQADMHTHCVPIIMYCIPTLREISVTTRADKVFLMPAQVLGSDTWLQRERETERVGTNRNIHRVSMNWVIGVCVYNKVHVVHETIKTANYRGCPTHPDNGSSAGVTTSLGKLLLVAAMLSSSKTNMVFCSCL